MRLVFRSFIFFIFIGICTGSFAADGLRGNKTLGVDLTYLESPTPSYAGLAGTYYLSQSLKIRGIWGQHQVGSGEEKISSNIYGSNLTYLFSPKKRSLFISGGVSYWTGPTPQDFFAVPGDRRLVPDLNLGLDYVTSWGLHISFGFNVLNVAQRWEYIHSNVSEAISSVHGKLGNNPFVWLIDMFLVTGYLGLGGFQFGFHF